MAKSGDKVYAKGAMPPASSVRRDKTAASYTNVGVGFGIGKGQTTHKGFAVGKGLPGGSHKKGVC